MFRVQGLGFIRIMGLGGLGLMGCRVWGELDRGL